MIVYHKDDDVSDSTQFNGDRYAADRYRIVVFPDGGLKSSSFFDIGFVSWKDDSIPRPNNP